jgi:hypothetical protein
MKRKDFFKTLFGVAAAAVVAPSVLAKEGGLFDFEAVKEELDLNDKIDNKIIKTGYTSDWASLYDINFKPEIWEEWYKNYGKDF